MLWFMLYFSNKHQELWFVNMCVCWWLRQQNNILIAGRATVQQLLSKLIPLTRVNIFTSLNILYIMYICVWISHFHYINMSIGIIFIAFFVFVCMCVCGCIQTLQRKNIIILQQLIINNILDHKNRAIKRKKKHIKWMGQFVSYLREIIVFCLYMLINDWGEKIGGRHRFFFSFRFIIDHWKI